MNVQSLGNLLDLNPFLQAELDCLHFKTRRITPSFPWLGISWHFRPPLNFQKASIKAGELHRQTALPC
jgi:hypothetical protein